VEESAQSAVALRIHMRQAYALIAPDLGQEPTLPVFTKDCFKVNLLAVVTYLVGFIRAYWAIIVFALCISCALLTKFDSRMLCVRQDKILNFSLR
jgi:hypothetical protein